MSKIEDVARALDLSLWEAMDIGTEMPFARQISLDAARRAIEAMREPEVEMIAAFWRQKNTGTQVVGETGDARSDYDAYRAMIDAALSEVKG